MELVPTVTYTNNVQYYDVLGVSLQSTDSDFDGRKHPPIMKQGLTTYTHLVGSAMCIKAYTDQIPHEQNMSKATLFNGIIVG